MDTIGLPAEQKRSLQGERLSALVDRLATGDNAFWSERLADVAPASITSVDDLPRLPFTVKQDLRDQYPLGMVTIPVEATTRLHASSGTSGKPTIVVYTPTDLAIWAEVNARALALAGTRSDDILHNGYGYGLFTGGLGLHYGGERLGCTVVPVSGGNTALQLQLLEDLGSRVLSATPSFCLVLAERAHALGIRDRLGVEIGILGAEPWSEGMRERIHEAWGGNFTALDIYGLSEIIGPGVAMEAPDDLGALNVFDDHFLPEIVDPATGQPYPMASSANWSSPRSPRKPCRCFGTAPATSPGSSPIRVTRPDPAPATGPGWPASPDGPTTCSSSGASTCTRARSRPS